jgi:hypothetical protein
MTKNFFCRGALGDIILCLPTIIALGGGNLYLRKEHHWQTVRRLLEKQDYINCCELELPGVHIDHNLDTFRPINKSNRSIHIAKCILMSQNTTYDISEPWLFNIEKTHIADVIINRTARYHDKNIIDWNSLKSTNCTFIGSRKEHTQFCNQYFSLPYYDCKDALEIASVIKGSKFFVGNSSLSFAIAEAMKHKRVLEVCFSKPSCLPQGYDGYISLHEELLRL